MLHPEFCYVDAAFGGTDKRNNLREIRGLKSPNVADCYRTVYRYPEAMMDHFKQQNTVGGYKGALYADWLPIDIDNEDLDEAQTLAQVLLEQLKVRYDVELAQVMCFFSGAKGFHILLPQAMFGWEPGTDLSRRMREAAEALADGIDIDTSIYDKVRLFRLNNTKHSKSGLYKIPLYAPDIYLMPIDQIRDLAKQPRAGVEWEEPAPNTALQALWASTERKEVPAPAVPSGAMVQGDRWSKPCVMAMLQGGLKPGNRQAISFRLAVHFRKQGMNGPMILAALQQWNHTNADGLEERELVHAVEQAVNGEYDFGCNDPLMQEFCQGKCPHKATRPTTAELAVMDIKEAQKRYEDYISLLRTAKVTLGVPKLDEAMRGIAPGETCWIIARAGVGKTAFLLNILANNSERGADSLFCSLEMPAAQVFERGVQMSAEQGGDEVEQVFVKTINAREHNAPLPVEYAKWSEQTWRKLALVRLADADSMGIEEVEAAVGQYELRFGKKPRILAIDYLGRMDGGRGPAYEVVSRLSKETKSLAKRLGLAVIVLHQVSREGGAGDQEVTMSMARDSGQVEESADFMIGLWRPDMKDNVKQDMEPIRAAVLKCRKGRHVQTNFYFHKVHMRFIPFKE